MKTKLVKLAALLSALLLISGLNAQDSLPKKIKEYGLGFSGLNAYSLQYHWGNEYKFQSLGLNIGAGFANNVGNGVYANTTSSINSNYNSKDQSPYNVSFGIGYTNARFKKVNDKFGLNFGHVASLNFQLSRTNGKATTNSYNQTNTSETTITNQTYRPSFGLYLGVYYRFSKEFILYAGLTPNIYYSYGVNTVIRSENITGSNPDPILTKNTNTTYSNNFGLGFSNSGAFITLAYRITYK